MKSKISLLKLFNVNNWGILREDYSNGSQYYGKVPFIRVSFPPLINGKLYPEIDDVMVDYLVTGRDNFETYKNNSAIIIIYKFKLYYLKYYYKILVRTQFIREEPKYKLGDHFYRWLPFKTNWHSNKKQILEDFDLLTLSNDEQEIYNHGITVLEKIRESYLKSKIEDLEYMEYHGKIFTVLLVTLLKFQLLFKRKQRCLKK